MSFIKQSARKWIFIIGFFLGFIGSQGVYARVPQEYIDHTILLLTMVESYAIQTYYDSSNEVRETPEGPIYALNCFGLVSHCLGNTDARDAFNQLVQYATDAKFLKRFQRLTPLPGPIDYVSFFHFLAHRTELNPMPAMHQNFLTFDVALDSELMPSAEDSLWQPIVDFREIQFGDVIAYVHTEDEIPERGQHVMIAHAQPELIDVDPDQGDMLFSIEVFDATKLPHGDDDTRKSSDADRTGIGRGKMLIYTDNAGRPYAMKWRTNGPRILERVFGMGRPLTATRR